MAAATQLAKQKKGSTQTFVGVMSKVWLRPSLTAMELGWRWLAGAPLLLLLLCWMRRHAVLFGWAWAQWQTMTFFHPAEMAWTIGATSDALWQAARPSLALFLPVAWLGWSAVGAAGQWAIARRLLGPDCRAQWASVLVLRLLRALGVMLCWGLWLAGVLLAAHYELTTKATLGAEPDVLVFLAVCIVFSLALFVGWAVMSWPLTLALATNARDGKGAFAALHEAIRDRQARSEVIEVNLVMCIVKIALVVLAMTFSACPLPFTSVATPEFLRGWWLAMVLFYMLASDYFHTVRFVAYVFVHRDAPNRPENA